MEDVGKAGLAGALAVLASSFMSNKQITPVQEDIDVISEELEKLGNESDRIKKNSADILKVYSLYKDEKSILVSVIQRQEAIISSLTKSFISLQQSLHQKNILKFTPLISKDVYRLATTSILKQQTQSDSYSESTKYTEDGSDESKTRVGGEKKENVLDAIKDL